MIPFSCVQKEKPYGKTMKTKKVKLTLFESLTVLMMTLIYTHKHTQQPFVAIETKSVSERSATTPGPFLMPIACTYM